MPTSLHRLLPQADTAPRCAEHARTIALDPGGTAIRADRVVLVAAPLPWPKPALDHPLVAPLRELLAGSAIPTRLLATVPRDSDDGIEVTVFDRDGGSAVERRYRVDSPEYLWELGVGLVDSDFEAIGLWLVSPATVAAPTVLICTQGSHDVCCGSDGVRFATEVEAELDVTLHRVSHTGGHRFAPTGMTLPDGRMWADLDIDALRRIGAEIGPAEELADRCRGWWGADTGPAQVAERAVFAEYGWELNGSAREVLVAEPAADGLRRCTVTTEAATFDVVVADGRTVPTIACREPGGLPAKEAQEYEVRSISRTR